MRKFIILLTVVANLCLSATAQDDIKRPESYFYQSGIEAYNAQDFQKSMEFFDKELEQNPKNGYAILWKACIYNYYEQYGQALSSINQAIKLIPKKDRECIGMGYGLRGSIQAELGDTVKALSDYDQAIKVYPKNLKYIYEKCNILNLQEKYDAIDSELKRAFSVDDNNAVTWVYSGRNEEAKGNHEKAIENYTYAAKLNPMYSSAYSFRADTYMNIHKYKEACQDVISALSIDFDTKAYLQMFILADSAMMYLIPQMKSQQLREPNQSAWSYYLGLAKVHIEDYAGAEEAFIEALRIAEFEGQSLNLIYINLAETQNEIGKYSEALKNTDLCLALDSTDSRLWRDRSEIFYNTGKYTQAIDNASQAINSSPDNASLYYYRARLYMYNKMYRNALDDINTAITLEPEVSAYLNQRSEIYKKMGKNSEAIADCNAIIEKENAKPADEQDIESLAYAYARLGSRADAYSTIGKIDKGDNNKGTEYNLACLYSLLNDENQALAHFENALKLGYCEFVHIGNDTDLDNIRETSTFKSLVKQYEQKYSEGTPKEIINEDDYVEERTEVPFTKESGIYKVKCTINDLPLHFFFDTGAADVTISSVEAQFMLKNDYLKTTDLKGKEYYGTASGDIAEGTIIVLKKVNFGGLELTNVKATVVHNQKAPLLLGQSVLNKLGKIEIDYAKNALVIISKKKK